MEIHSANSEAFATLIRAAALRMTNQSKASHIGSCLSIADILAVFYSDNLTQIGIRENDISRNVFILSKGHAAAILYAALHEIGMIPIKDLKEYGRDGANLGGHATSKELNGVELTTGSLGHGLPYGAGIAYQKVHSGIPGVVYVLISDGECNEGTTWETALFASHHKLNNLKVIIDRNRLQSLAGTEETVALEPLAEKWEAFGWQVIQVSGHNHDELKSAFEIEFSKPTCIIANTTKGKGVSFMENSVAWHYKSPSDVELNMALSELEMDHAD